MLTSAESSPKSPSVRTETTIGNGPGGVDPKRSVPSRAGSSPTVSTLKSGVATGRIGVPEPLPYGIVSLTDEPSTVSDGHDPWDACHVSVGQIAADSGFPRKPGGRCN